MPSQSAHAANCRADGFKPRLFLSDMSGSVLATFEVDADPAEGALSLTGAILTGSLDNAYRGMRIVVADASGTYKGTVSVGYRSVVTPTSIPVRELSSGEVPVEAGDILTVYDDLLPTDMLPAADLTFAPDSDGYQDQNDLYDPFVNSGGSNVGRLVGGVFDSPFYGSPSFLVDPDSSTPVTHLWTATGAPSFVVGNLNSADPTLRWTAAGKYRVTHLIEDPDNTQTAVQFPRVRIHDDNDPPYDIQLTTPPTGNPETGFTFSFTVFDSPSIAELRDGAHVILWSEDTNDSGAFLLTPKVPGRGHIVAEGYLRRDESTLGDEVNGVTFEVISPIAKLAELPGFSKVFIRDQTPTAWNEYKSQTLGIAEIALLRVYSNLTQIFDLVFDGFSDADFPLIYMQKQNPFEQVREDTKSRAARLTCDRTGRLEIQGELWDVPLTDRSGITKAFTFTADDRLPGSVLKREHVRPLELYRLRGFVAGTAPTTEQGTTAPVFAKYPATPARGGQVIIEERGVFDNAHTDIFARCSRAAAWANADYWNADDRSATWQHAPEYTVQFPLQYARMFNNYREYYGHDGTALDEYGRQVDLSDFDWIAMSVSEDYGSQTCQVVFRAATYAPAFMSADDTPATDNTLPPWEPPTVPPITNPTLIPGTISYGVNRMALIMVAGLAWTLNFQSAYPVWNFASWASLGVSGTVRAWVPNGYEPGSGWLCTSTNIYYLNLATRVATDKHTWSATALSVSADASFATQNHFVAVASMDSAGGIVACYTTDNSTFTEVTVDSDYNSDVGYIGYAGCYVSSKTPLLVWTTAYTSTSATPTGSGYRSLGGGATWSTFSSPDLVQGAVSMELAGQIHVPWHNNPSENIVYFGDTPAANTLLLYRSIGGVATDISPIITANKYGINARTRDVVASSVLNRQRMLFIGQRSGGNCAGFLSNTAGTSWVNYLADGTNARRCALAGDALDIAWDWGVSAFIRQLSINGDTVLANDKQGDLLTYSNSEVLAITGY